MKTIEELIEEYHQLERELDEAYARFCSVGNALGWSPEELEQVAREERETTEDVRASFRPF